MAIKQLAHPNHIASHPHMTHTMSPQAFLRLLRAVEKARWYFHEGVDLVAYISREHNESIVRGYLILGIPRNHESEVGPDRQLLSKTKEVIALGEMSGLRISKIVQLRSWVISCLVIQGLPFCLIASNMLCLVPPLVTQSCPPTHTQKKHRSLVFFSVSLMWRWQQHLQNRRTFLLPWDLSGATGMF